MQQIPRKTKVYASYTKLRKIIDLVKSPQFEFDWPEFMPKPSIPIEQVKCWEDMDRRIASSLRQLPPNLRRHLRYLAKNWSDEWAGRRLNSPFAGHSAGSDPLYADLPPQILMFETGQPILLIVQRYQEVRRWHEVLLRIARQQFPLYMGFQLSARADGTVVWERDELSEALDGVDLRYIRECKECHSVYLEKRLSYQGRPVEPHCSPKCGQRIRQARSPRKPRPPSRLEEVRLAVKSFCKANNLKEFARSKENIDLLSKYADFRPTTIERCLDYLQTQKPAKETKR